MFATHNQISIEDVFQAYMDCRKNKRNSPSAIAFEVNYEQNCVELWQEINSLNYCPKQSITFIVTKPVRREVFAADFRDRVIHHLIINKIGPLLESEFIEETSNCRKGKGTHYGIRTLNEHILKCSDNYSKPCWVLRLDIKSFFMNINKNRLCKLTIDFVNKDYTGEDKEVLLYLIRQTILNSPEKNCVRHSHINAWKELPSDKSLFSSPEGYGIPIGNLTSQIGANFFLNEFDHWVKSNFAYYGRYVDDFYIVSEDKPCLVEFIDQVKEKLSELELTLHPNKIYLQPVAKGIKFVGVVIKPGRIYIGNRTRNNFYQRIEEFNRAAKCEGYVEDHAEYFACCMNSYFGIMKHYSTYAIRRKAAKRIAKEWWNVAYISGHFEKISVKNRYKRSRKMMKEISKSIK